MNRLHTTLIALGIAGASAASWGQILIGQTIGLTGAVAATVKESNMGAQFYFDAVNARGGIGGEKIELITLDDKFDPKLAAANARELIEKRDVIGLFMNRGTPHTEAMTPVLDQYGVPLVAPSTGAMVLHQPLKKHVFNVRATYQREAARVISHLSAVGSSRIALVYVDDSFGADALEGAQKGLAENKLSAVAVFKFDRAKPDFSQIAPNIAKLAPHAVLIVGSGTAVVDAIKAIKNAGSTAQYVTLSNNASSGFIKLLGDYARGVIVSQVLPQSQNYGLVGEAAALARARDVHEVSPAMLEGIAGAKVLVEALRRAGPKPTREKLQRALENMNKFDIGGLTVSFSQTDHTGLDFVDISIISETGKFRR
jgi:branched-chain amino acid transport system substrate-binding protein